MSQQAIITLRDLDKGRVDVRSQFLPEIKGHSPSPSVRLWKLLMDTVKAENRAGDWMLTYGGHQFVPTAPNPDTMFITDIAHALSQICRFGGHTLEFYSVAQHCVHVSRLVPKELALVGLMHDATEAYIGDMVHPLKVAMAKFRQVEDVLWQSIAQKFNLPDTNPTDDPIIKHADIVACMTERRDLMTNSPHKWGEPYESTSPDDARLIPLPPKAAEQLFLDRFNELTST